MLSAVADIQRLAENLPPNRSKVVDRLASVADIGGAVHSQQPLWPQRRQEMEAVFSGLDYLVSTIPLAG